MFLINISFVSAFSIATLYGENYPLRMKAGEMKETFFLLRNVAEGDGNVNVNVELTKGVEVASLIDGAKSYKVLFGEEIEIPVRIKVPEDSIAGKTYYVGAMFKPSPSEAEGGNIQFLINIGKSFPIIVIGEPKESSKSSSLTLEEDRGLTESFAPSFKEGSNIWSVLIVVLLVGVFAIIILLVYLVIKTSRMRQGQIIVQGVQGAQSGNAGYYQQ